MENKITFDVRKIIAKDLDGRVIPVNSAKAIGNAIYLKASTIEWDKIARTIHAGKPVEVSATELAMMQAILLAQDSPLLLFFKEALKAYFDTLNKKNNGK